MLMIGPVEKVFEHVEADDGVLLVGAIGFVGAKTNGQFDGQESTKAKVRTYVREAMRSEDKETRELALHAMFTVYGLDAVAGSAKEGYRFNQEFLDALQEMATNDPDGGLRARAQHILDTKDQRLKRLVRRIENPELYKSKGE